MDAFTALAIGAGVLYVAAKAGQKPCHCRPVVIEKDPQPAKKPEYLVQWEISNEIAKQEADYRVKRELIERLEAVNYHHEFICYKCYNCGLGKRSYMELLSMVRRGSMQPQRLACSNDEAAAELERFVASELERERQCRKMREEIEKLESVEYHHYFVGGVACIRCGISEREYSIMATAVRAGRIGMQDLICRNQEPQP